MTEKKVVNNNKKKPYKKFYNNNKKKKKEFAPVVLPDLYPNGKPGGIEYHMPAAVAEELLKNRKGPDLKMAPQVYLCKYVDESCGLMYRCVKVTLI